MASSSEEYRAKHEARKARQNRKAEKAQKRQETLKRRERKAAGKAREAAPPKPTAAVEECASKSCPTRNTNTPATHLLFHYESNDETRNRESQILGAEPVCESCAKRVAARMTNDGHKVLITDRNDPYAKAKYGEFLWKYGRSGGEKDPNVITAPDGSTISLESPEEESNRIRAISRFGHTGMEEPSPNSFLGVTRQIASTRRVRTTHLSDSSLGAIDPGFAEVENNLRPGNSAESSPEDAEGYSIVDPTENQEVNTGFSETEADAPDPHVFYQLGNEQTIAPHKPFYIGTRGHTTAAEGVTMARIAELPEGIKTFTDTTQSGNFWGIANKDLPEESDTSTEANNARALASVHRDLSLSNFREADARRSESEKNAILREAVKNVRPPEVLLRNTMGEGPLGPHKRPRLSDWFTYNNRFENGDRISTSQRSISEDPADPRRHASEIDSMLSGNKDPIVRPDAGATTTDPDEFDFSKVTGWEVPTIDKKTGDLVKDESGNITVSGRGRVHYVFRPKGSENPYRLGPVPSRSPERQEREKNYICLKCNQAVGGHQIEEHVDFHERPKPVPTRVPTQTPQQKRPARTLPSDVTISTGVPPETAGMNKLQREQFERNRRWQQMQEDARKLMRGGS